MNNETKQLLNAYYTSVVVDCDTEVELSDLRENQLISESKVVSPGKSSPAFTEAKHSVVRSYQHHPLPSKWILQRYILQLQVWTVSRETLRYTLQHKTPNDQSLTHSLQDMTCLS